MTEDDWSGALRRAEDALDRAERAAPAQVLERVDEVAHALDDGLNPARIVAGLHDDADVQGRAAAAMGALMSVRARLAGSPAIARALAASAGRDGDDPRRARYHAWLVRRARRAGAYLDETTARALAEERAQIEALEAAMVENIQVGSSGIVVDAEELDGVPAADVAALERLPDGRVRVRTVPAQRLPVIAHARSERVRRALYCAWGSVGDPTNQPILAELLARRTRVAHALGYASAATLALEGTMAGRVEVVREHLDAWTRALTPARQTVMRELARLRGDDAPLEEWQWYRLQQVYKREQLGMDVEELRAYFSAPDTVRLALTAVSTRWGVELMPSRSPAWLTHAQSFEVRREGRPYGALHLDLHPRPGKYAYAATAPLVTGVGEARLPEVVVVGSLPAGEWDHFHLVQLFHELGHAMHHLSARGEPWLELASFEMEEDCSEVPSLLMEELGWRGAVLGELRRGDGATLSPETWGRVRRAALSEEVTRRQREIGFAAVCLEYHADPTLDIQDDAVLRAVWARHAPFALVEGTRPDLGLLPLASTGTMHYTYLWSAAIARELAEDARIASDRWRSFADEVVAATPRAPAAELLARYLGRAPGSVTPIELG